MHYSAYFPNKRELTLTTFNNPCDFFETFSQNLLISLKLTVLVSSFLKQPVEQNKRLNHTLHRILLRVLLLLSCETSVSVKENSDRKKRVLCYTSMHLRNKK